MYSMLKSVCFRRFISGPTVFLVVIFSQAAGWDFYPKLVAS